MNGPIRSGRQGQAGYVSVYVALVASLVLVPLVMLVIDMATLAYYRTKLQSTADALAIAAVAESRSLHIPIPTRIVGFVPVEGYLINGLHLSNLSMSIGVGGIGGNSAFGEKLTALAALHQDQTGPKLAIDLEYEKPKVMPFGNFFSPFMYVKVPVNAKVKPQTPFLARLLGSKTGEISLRAESCAAAWYRVDNWAQGWGIQRFLTDPDQVTKVLDSFIDLSGEPQKYYRRVNCLTETANWIGMAELVLTEHLQVGEGKDWLKEKLGTGVMEAIDKWGNPDKKVKRAHDSLKEKKEALKNGCQPGDPCIEPGKSGDWVADEQTRSKAEEEAEKEREKAREEAARKAQQATQGQGGGS